MKIQYGSATISPSLIEQLYKIYRDGILRVGTGKTSKIGINGYTESAISAYPIVIAAWEAYMYEILLSSTNLSQNPESKIHAIPPDIIDKWDIISKSIIVPDLLYGNTFDKGAQPFQDFSSIVVIRNSIVHFKYDQPVTRLQNVMKDLTQRGVFMPQIPESPDPDATYNIAWPWAVSSTEAIRWCINTLYSMAYSLDKFIPETKKSNTSHLLGNFSEITIEKATKIFIELGVDPDSRTPSR